MNLCYLLCCHCCVCSNSLLASDNTWCPLSVKLCNFHICVYVCVSRTYGGRSVRNQVASAAPCDGPADNHSFLPLASVFVSATASTVQR